MFQASNNTSQLEDYRSRSFALGAKLLSDMKENIKGGLGFLHTHRHTHFTAFSVTAVLCLVTRHMTFFESGLQRSHTSAPSKIFSAECHLPSISFLPSPLCDEQFNAGVHAPKGCFLCRVCGHVFASCKRVTVGLKCQMFVSGINGCLWTSSKQGHDAIANKPITRLIAGGNIYIACNYLRDHTLSWVHLRRGVMWTAPAGVSCAFSSLMVL